MRNRGCRARLINAGLEASKLYLKIIARRDNQINRDELRVIQYVN